MQFVGRSSFLSKAPREGEGDCQGQDIAPHTKEQTRAICPLLAMSPRRRTTAQRARTTTTIILPPRMPTRRSTTAASVTAGGRPHQEMVISAFPPPLTNILCMQFNLSSKELCPINYARHELIEAGCPDLSMR